MVDRLGPDRRRRELSPWHLLLLLPFPAVLWVPFYNKIDPVLFGFPFFYAYQILAVVVTAVLTGIVYWTTRSG